MGRQQRLAQLRRQRETRAPFVVGRGIEPYLVAPAFVAHHEVEVFQRQRRRLAQFIGPAQLAAADRDLGLREQPVGRGVVLAFAGRGQGQSCNPQLARAVAPRLEQRRVDKKLLHAQAQQRARRHRHHHAGQFQRGLAVGALQRDLAEFDDGYQPFAARRDRTDAHGYPQGARGQAFELRTVLADSRHNESMEHPPSGGKQQPEGQQQTQ